MRVTVTTDGAAKPNPGYTRIGVIIEDSEAKVLSVISESTGFGTSNSAEYKAIIRGLEESASLNASIVVIYTDSQLCERQLNGSYKIANKRLKPLWGRIKKLESKFTKVRYRWHSRTEGRGPQADALAEGGEKAANTFEELLGD